jgi:hypothetical protein
MTTAQILALLHQLDPNSYYVVAAQIVNHAVNRVGA